MQKLLPDIRQLSDFYVFQQDSVPEFIPPTLWPPNSPDLNLVDYKVWPVMQEKVYKNRVKDNDENCVHVSWQLGTKWISALLMQQSDSGEHVFVHALKPKADTLNTHWVSNEFWQT